MASHLLLELVLQRLDQRVGEEDGAIHEDAEGALGGAGSGPAVSGVAVDSEAGMQKRSHCPVPLLTLRYARVRQWDAAMHMLTLRNARVQRAR